MHGAWKTGRHFVVQIVGSRMVRCEGCSSRWAVAAHVLDRRIGSLLPTFLNPTGENRFVDHFGRCVAFVGDNVLIGASQDDTSAENAGAEYLFDGKTGKLLYKFLCPNPAADARFGIQVAALGNDILIAADGYGGKSPGAVYLFKGVD